MNCLNCMTTFLGRCYQRQTSIGLVVIWFLIVLFATFKLPEQNVKVVKLQDVVQQEIQQSDLDYFAEKIQLNYSVRQNTFHNEMLYEAEINLTNTGSRTFPWKSWSIVFCQPYLAEPRHYPYPKGLSLPKYGIKLFSLGGGVYRIEAMDVLDGMMPGGTRSIRFVSHAFNIAITDNYPNWYFAVSGLESRIIESTKGESYEWVGKYDTPNLWKRANNRDDSNFDYYNPFTPDERFDLHSVKDVKTAPLPVIPTPAVVEKYEPTVKVNVLSGSWVIVATTPLSNGANYLADVWGLRIVVQTPKQEYISFINEPIAVTAQGKVLPFDESYELRVDPLKKAITIKASQPAGAFYGVQTLISLADIQGNVSEAVIQDAPRFKYRGVMLDVARNFQNREKIFRYINVMAMYKLNKLHLHLTDDEGWRLVIPGLQELTEIGAKRCHDLSETKCLLPFLGSGPFTGPPGSGFYTVKDYRAILRYAALHHIEVIPEIDMPGHSHAAIKAMEARRRLLLSINSTEAARFLLQDLQDESEYRSVQGFLNNAINPCLQSTYTFISRVIETLFAMHRDSNPLKTFHFGGDEVANGAWTKSPVCERLQRSGMNMPLADYLAVQVSNMTSLYGLDLAGWEDGFMGTKAPLKRNLLRNKNVYAFAWNNVWALGTARRAYDFANSGYQVILTSATNLYFDHPHEPDPEERGLYWATRYTDTFHVYSFMPENLYWNALTAKGGAKISICDRNDCPTLEKRENIVGMQGTLFGELLRTQLVTDLMVLPRLLALAERAWHETTWESESDKAKRDEGMLADWTNFANTVGYKELARLDKMGYKYRIPVPGAKIEGDTLYVSVAFPGLPVEMSQDGGQTWQELPSSYQATMEKDKPCSIRTRSASGLRYSKVVTFLAAEDANSSSSVLISFVQIITFVFITFLLQ